MTRYRRSTLRGAPRIGSFACTPFMCDIGSALSLKFILLGLLYCAFFDNGDARRAHPDDAVAAGHYPRAVLPAQE